MHTGLMPLSLRSDQCLMSRHGTHSARHTFRPAHILPGTHYEEVMRPSGWALYQDVHVVQASHGVYTTACAVVTLNMTTRP